MVLQQAGQLADGQVVLAAFAIQPRQRHLQLGGARLVAHHLGQRGGGAVGFVIHQGLQAGKVRGRHMLGLAQHLAHVHPRRQPAQPKEHRKNQQPPKFKILHGKTILGVAQSAIESLGSWVTWVC